MRKIRHLVAMFVVIIFLANISISEARELEGLDGRYMQDAVQVVFGETYSFTQNKDSSSRGTTEIYNDLSITEKCVLTLTVNIEDENAKGEKFGIRCFFGDIDRKVRAGSGDYITRMYTGEGTTYTIDMVVEPGEYYFDIMFDFVKKRFAFELCVYI